jgi:YbbR domain-containing protein
MLNKIFYNFLIKNIHLKIISLILAFVVFLSVHVYSNKNVLQSIDIGISLSIPSDMMVVNRPPAKISVLVKGSLSDIKKIMKKNISIPIKLEKSETIVIKDTNLPEMAGLKIIGIMPQSIDFIIEKIKTKKVPIQFNTINELPAGYKYEVKPHLTQKTVVVEGPESSINLLEKVYSQPLDQSKILGSESKILKLKLESPLLKFKNQREVSVNYKIIEEYITKEINNVKIKLLNCDLNKEGITALKKEVKLVVKMPYSLKDKYHNNDFFVYADLKDCSEYEYLTQIKLLTEVPHPKIIPQYISPDTIILKRDKKNINKHSKHKQSETNIKKEKK